MKKYLITTVFIILVFTFLGNSQNNLTIYNLKIFKNVAWDLAQAVDKENVVEIDKILEEGKINVDVREEKFGMTLLIWAVLLDKYKSTEALLKHGANPNLKSNNSYISAIIAASSRESKFLNLVLKYGGDPNNTAGFEEARINPSPLFAAAETSLENVKILVNAGAKIDFKNMFNRTALFSAVLRDRIDIVRYLLIEKNAEFKYVFLTTLSKKKLFIVNSLRNWTFALDSDEYKIKMEIVDYLKKKGMDYWKTPIPRKLYKHYSKEYLEKY